jgi:hypothetical protein
MQDATRFRVGDRVRLIEMDDPYHKNIPIGVTGTVTGVTPPPINVLNVRWDDGFALNPCLDVDRVART